jgi:hypothetical protein
VPSDLLVCWPVPAVALAIAAAATTAGVAVTTISAAATSGGVAVTTISAAATTAGVAVTTISAAATSGGSAAKTPAAVTGWCARFLDFAHFSVAATLASSQPANNLFFDLGG